MTIELIAELQNLKKRIKEIHKLCADSRMAGLVEKELIIEKIDKYCTQKMYHSEISEEPLPPDYFEGIE